MDIEFFDEFYIFFEYLCMYILCFRNYDCLKIKGFDLKIV